LGCAAGKSNKEVAAEVGVWPQTVGVWPPGRVGRGPFAWTKTADEILERLATYLQRIPGAGH